MAEALAHPGAAATGAQPRAVLHRPDLPVFWAVTRRRWATSRSASRSRARLATEPAHRIGAAAARHGRARAQGDLAAARRLPRRGDRPRARSSATGATSPPRSTTGRSCTGWRASRPPRSRCTATCSQWCRARAIARASRSTLLNLAMLEIVARRRRARGTRCSMKRWRFAVETGSRPASQCVVDVAAGLATLRGDLERAARLHGAAAAQAAETGPAAGRGRRGVPRAADRARQGRPAGRSVRRRRGCRPRALARRDARGRARLARTRYPAAARSRRRLIAGRRYSFIISGSMT